MDSVVREDQQLTYDANFRLCSFDRSKVGWYLVSVITSPHEAKQALASCQSVLNSLSKNGAISRSTVQSTVSSLLSKHHMSTLSNQFWVEALTGTQSASIPWKSIQCITDYESMLTSITTEVSLVDNYARWLKEGWNGDAHKFPFHLHAGRPRIGRADGFWQGCSCILH